MKKFNYKKVFLTLMLLVFISTMCCVNVNAYGYGAYLQGISCADGADRYEWIEDTYNAVACLKCSQVMRGRYNTATMALEALQNSEVFIVHTHGIQDRVQYTDSDGNITYMTVAMINRLPDEALSNLKLVIYGTCNAGEGEDRYVNIVNATKNKGADVVIGFKDKTYTPQVNRYLTAFLKSIGEDKETYQKAMQDGVFWAKFYNFGVAGGVDEPYACGTLTKTYFE